MENNKHYICTGGCEGVSNVPGVCQAEDCPDHGKSLKECDCADGGHDDVKNEEKKQEAGGFAFTGPLIALLTVGVIFSVGGFILKDEIKDAIGRRSEEAPASIEEAKPMVIPFPTRPLEDKPVELPKEPGVTRENTGFPEVTGVPIIPPPVPVPAPTPVSAPVTATGEWRGQYTVTAPPECKGEVGGWQAFLSENSGVISGQFSADAGVSGTVGGSRSGDMANWSVKSGGASGIGFSGAISGNTMSGNFTGLTCYKNPEKRRSTGTYFGGRIVPI